MNWITDEPGADALEVRVAELLVATADESDFLVDKAVPDVLRLLREKMQMDVVFVSEFTDGKRVFRHVEQTPGKEVIAQGAADPLEESWCQRVVDGRLPERITDGNALMARGQAPAAPFTIGTHLSTPVVLKDGEVYGTLCCFSFGESPHNTEQDLRKLRYTAQLTADKIDRTRRHADAYLPPESKLELEPMQVDSGFRKR